MTEENWGKYSEIISFQSNFEKEKWFAKNNLQMLPTDTTCNFWANGNLSGKGNVWVPWDFVISGLNALCDGKRTRYVTDVWSQSVNEQNPQSRRISCFHWCLCARGQGVRLAGNWELGGSKNLKLFDYNRMFWMWVVFHIHITRNQSRS
jgi:hypothetical protein